ncbi:hypothetical protein Lo5R7ANS_01 [Mesorhizobium phage vB_MloP_Lo5R7ANS]|uniref:Uncharacterized protein n=1 Tax=Mesorhizobium phage vB_MloP_Lo5R7ANS TaxID=1527771 RepID=A0A076YQH0_9CAUD|nr:hypothetical protein Lo5R7ANS_01 [Mesorhizobium phage vB_MloP_Lo5R7ANS]AIK68471.1 hypothetical protein Lo5R7ANS_01 [Mesorhizobium phage vB_MloP_Lo5R7ANS]
MTIHATFWHERQRVAWRTAGIGGGLATCRDSNRQRSYDCENKHLRPLSGKFDNRQAAKGFARLCANIAIRRMVETGLIKSDTMRDAVRSSFTAAFTKEAIGHCNANATGAYFASWGWTDAIIAHEVAHWADQWAHKLGCPPTVRASYEPHGAKWRGWFTYILCKASDRFTVEGVKRAWATDRLAVQMP